MVDLQQRVEILISVFEQWLSDENQYLLRAVQQTAEEGYFSFPDVQFALKSLRKSLTEKSITKWINQSRITDENDARGEHVLCLHAGNLPLVGFQDALAVLLSGARYTGKISRRDPYLLPTFLNEVKKTAVWNDMDVQWSHRLDDFEDMPHDAVLFAGSRQSVPEVKKAINRFNLKKEETNYLVRTAHFSLAYFDSKEPKDIQSLVQAMLRYGGQGCRSVAGVVSPLALSEISEQLTKHIRDFWKQNPQHKKSPPVLKQRYAYNRALKRSQLWVHDFLVEENSEPSFDQDFLCYWQQGEENDLQRWANQHKDDVQSIYTLKNNEIIPGFEKRTEHLFYAQKPPIYWKPDGIDILQWLVEIN